MPFPHWGDVPTWVAAGAALLALGSAVLAYRKQSAAFGKQAEQVDLQRQQLEDQRKLSEKQGEVLELQARELRESLAERQRETAGRRGAQAAQVFITEKPAERPRGRVGVNAPPTPPPPGITATVHNTSSQPIYDTEFRWHLGTAGHGEPNPQPTGTVMPGGEESRTRIFPERSNPDVIGAVVRFRDAAGVTWLRRPDGELLEQPPASG